MGILLLAAVYLSVGVPAGSGADPPPQVEDISQRDYFPAVLREITNARVSIVVVMYARQNPYRHVGTVIYRLKKKYGEK